MRAISLFRVFSLAILISLVGSISAQTVGALGNGVSSRSIALGGATVASSLTPLEAMQSNPAALTQVEGRSVDLSFS
jgi:hypothetical protein